MYGHHPQSYSNCSQRLFLLVFAEPVIVTIPCPFRLNLVLSFLRQSSSPSLSSTWFFLEDLIVYISSSILLTNLSTPWKPFSSSLFKNRMQLHGSFWYILLMSTLQTKRPASDNFLLSAPSTTWTIVWNLGNSLMTSSLERLSPMKSHILQVFLPTSRVEVLLVMEGTVSKGFPPQRPMKSWVFPEPLSPMRATYFLLGLDLRLRKAMMTIMSTANPMTYRQSELPCSTLSTEGKINSGAPC